MTQKINNQVVVAQRNSYAIGAVTILFSIVCLVIINKLILDFYQVNIEEIKSQFSHLFIGSLRDAILPEPQEKLQYIITALLLPITLLLSYVGIKYCAQNILIAKYLPITFISLVLGFALLGLGILSHPDFYIEKAAFYSYLSERLWPQFVLYLPYILLTSPLATLLVLYARRNCDAYQFIAFVSLGLFFLISYLGLKQDPNNFLYANTVPFYQYLRHEVYLKLAQYLPIIFLMSPLLAWLMFFDYKNSIGKILKGFFYVLIFALVTAVFWINTFNDIPFPVGLISSNVVFYSVAQVVNGNTLLVDFTNQYGLYPHFIAPIFQIIGLNALTYSVVMSALLCSSFLGIFMFMRKAIQNTFLLLLGFIAVIVFNYLLIRVMYSSFDPYFQYWPIRLLFPCLALYLASVYFQNRKKLIYFSSFILFSAGVLWNIDSGIVVFLAWMMLLCYDELFLSNRKLMILRIMRHIVFGFLIFALVLAAFATFIYLRSGSLPNFYNLFKYQQIFYGAGFFMMPMPLFHTWNIVILIYVVGLFVSIRSVIEKENSVHARMIFLLSILGIGLFSYYQGRSHDFVLPAVSYPATLLAAIFADRLLIEWRNTGFLIFPQKLLLVITTSVFLVALFFIMSPRSLDSLYKEARKGFYSLSPDYHSESVIKTDESLIAVMANIDFIKHNSVAGEKIFIGCKPYLEGIYYGYTGTRNAANVPGSEEMILEKDYENKIKFIMENRTYKIFIYSGMGSEIFKMYYKVVAESADGMQLLLPNTAIK